jgi:hypothetical protein
MSEAPPGPATTGPTRARRTPVADLFEETYHLYRGQFATMLLVYAAFEIPIVLATLPLTAWQARWSQFAYSPSAASIQRMLDELVPFLAVSVLFGLAAIILGTFAAAGVAYVAARARDNERPTPREVLSVLRSLTPALLGFVAVIVAAVLVLAVGFVAIGLFGFGIGAGRAVGTLLAVVAIFVAIGLAIVGVARFALTIPALVVEGLGPVPALRQSWSLVEGSTLRTFGIVLLAGLVVTVVASIATPVYLPGLMDGIINGSVASFVVVALVGGAVQTLLGPIVPTLLTVLYFDYVAYRRSG